MTSIDTLPMLNFEQPCNAQVASPLMCLPAELLNRIYRNLFICAEPLEAVEATDGSNNESYNGIVELSGQALACCQRLYKEASPLLYEQNTLLIRYKSIPDSVECHVLSAQIDLYTSARDPPEDEFGLWSYTQRNHRDNPQLATARLLRHSPSLALIRNVRVYIEYRYGFEMLIVCKTLQDLLLDKEVVISAVYLEHDPLEADLQHLKSCSMFRCRSIQFETKDKHDMAPLVRVIVSRKPVTDLYSFWNEFMLSVGKLCSAYKESFYGWQSQKGDHLSRLEEALCENDAAEFERETSIIQAQAIMFVKEKAQKQKVAEKTVTEARLAEINSKADEIISMFEQAMARRVKDQFSSLNVH